MVKLVITICGSPIATVLCVAMVKVVINLWVTYCCSAV